MPDVSSDKIKDFLSDPNNVNLIASLASSMSQGSGATAPLPVSESAPESFPAEQPDFPDKEAFPSSSQETTGKAVFSPQETSLPTLSQGLSLLSGMADGDHRVALLKAIKPYVSDDKKSRVDGLVKAISLAGFINNYKDDFGKFLS